MNLFEYAMWQKTKIWLLILIPAIVIFLFINPYVSLLLPLVVLGRLWFVAKLESIFEQTAETADVKNEQL